MDPLVLIQPDFWHERSPVAAGLFPGLLPDDDRLAGHVLFSTSGTSGTPTWIALSKDALLESARAVNAHLGIGAHSHWGLALPVHHVGGFGVIARAHAAACRFSQFTGRWDAVKFAAWLANDVISHTTLVPTQVHDLVTQRVAAPPKLEAVVVGGGQLNAHDGQAARDLGWPVLASYGMTEAGSQIATQSLAALAQPYQSAPLPMLPIWQARHDSTQRLEIAGPALFSGWLRPGIRSAWKFHPRESPWHTTQDLVTLDGRMLTPIGRADFVVKIMGELVNPTTIENQLLKLAAGNLPPAKLAVIAVPDARRGHRLVPAFDATTDPDIIDATLAAYAQFAHGPWRLTPPAVISPWPLSPLGKPLRSEILSNLMRSD